MKLSAETNNLVNDNLEVGNAFTAERYALH